MGVVFLVLEILLLSKFGPSSLSDHGLLSMGDNKYNQLKKFMVVEVALFLCLLYVQYNVKYMHP